MDSTKSPVVEVKVGGKSFETTVQLDPNAPDNIADVLQKALASEEAKKAGVDPVTDAGKEAELSWLDILSPEGEDPDLNKVPGQDKMRTGEKVKIPGAAKTAEPPKPVANGNPPPKTASAAEAPPPSPDGGKEQPRVLSAEEFNKKDSSGFIRYKGVKPENQDRPYVYDTATGESWMKRDDGMWEQRTRMAGSGEWQLFDRDTGAWRAVNPEERRHFERMVSEHAPQKAPRDGGYNASHFAGLFPGALAAQSYRQPAADTRGGRTDRPSGPSYRSTSVATGGGPGFPFLSVASSSADGGFSPAGGYGASGIDMMVDQQSFENKRQARKLTFMIQILLAAIGQGNIDAIENALTLISLKSKTTLIQASQHMILAMMGYEEQTNNIVNEMEKLAKKDPTAGQSMGFMQLSARMNQYSTARQAITNTVRDVMSMVEELATIEKSVYDKKDRDAQFYRWA